MKLNKELLNDTQLLEAKEIKFPEYDHEEMRTATLKTPVWLHFGAGNIFRAFIGQNVQNLLNEGEMSSGLLVAEGYDYEIVDLLQKYDNLTINVTLRTDGSIDNEVLASIAEYYRMNRDLEDFALLEEIAANPSLQLFSFTITEKGYSISDREGNFYPDVSSDFENGPDATNSYLGKIVSLLVNRYNKSQAPIALVSMDNMSQNGSKLEAAVMTFINEWFKRDLITKECHEFFSDRSKVSFPWSMIDKITPRPDQTVEDMLNNLGFEELGIQQSQKNSFVSPFVNSEEIGYLVIEDDFPNGRPPLDKAGIIFTNRETVHKVETMKVTTSLNPLHTALAIFGTLLEYNYIYETMEDDLLLKLIKVLGYDEGLPVVVDPVIISPQTFIDEVIDIRFPNRFIPDTPQRIATDTSQKLNVRYGETLKSYLKSDTLDIQELKVIPLIFAGWLRYLMGISDKGNSFELSPDPLLPQLKPLFESFELGKVEITEEIQALLKDEKIFGVDLVEVGLADKVSQYFLAMSQKEGSVRETIASVLSE